MGFPNGHYGRTLCNLSIVFNDFSEILVPELTIAAWFIISLHEFYHYLQRCLLRTHGEVLGYNTPRLKLLYQNSINIEAGYDIEKKLFGKIVNKIYIGGAKLLLKRNYVNNFEIFSLKFQKKKWRHMEKIL